MLTVHAGPEVRLSSGPCSLGRSKAGVRAGGVELGGQPSTGSGRQQGAWSGLRREVRALQEDIGSGLGGLMPLDRGLIHQVGLCPKRAETSICHERMGGVAGLEGPRIGA